MSKATEIMRRLHARLYRAALPSLGRVPLLWSKGISQYCDVKGPRDYWLLPTESHQPESFFRRHYADAAGLVWLRLSGLSRKGKDCDLDNFVLAALPSIRRPFALVTTDGDVSVPSELRPETVAALLDNPWLVAWHTQNLDSPSHPKLTPIAIGLDLHTPRRWQMPRGAVSLLESIRDRRLAAGRQPLRVFSDMNVRNHNQARRDATAALTGCGHVDFLDRSMPQAAIWQLYARYPFVLSVEGVGLDCHRTWELLYLGSIVITKTSPLDPLYRDLPVVIVDDWTEVRDESNLARWRERYAPLTGKAHVWPRLEPEAWLRPIRESLAKTGHESRDTRAVFSGPEAL
jgi:hypothetical protein